MFQTNFFIIKTRHIHHPSLSNMGKLRIGNKSNLMPCLENLAPVKVRLSTSRAQVSILDGADIVNMLRPGTAKTSKAYVTDVFVPYVLSQLQHVKRLGIVWDRCIADSLKFETRSTRGKGIRRKVEPQSAVPGNWQAFLRIDANKTEPFFSWLLTWLKLKLTNISSPHKTMAFFPPIKRMSLI